MVDTRPLHNLEGFSLSRTHKSLGIQTLGLHFPLGQDGVHSRNSNSRAEFTVEIPLPGRHALKEIYYQGGNQKQNYHNFKITVVLLSFDDRQITRNSETTSQKLKISKKKLSNLNNSYKSEFNSGFKNAIVDLNVLAGVFSEAAKCLQCGATGNLSCEENCSGGAVELDIIRDFCSYSCNFCSSKKCKAEIGKPSTYEVNTRFVYAMRCIGKGAEAARMFC
ncbi:hypothetical protein TNCV_4628671 [Trichonephila clavipes]|nr:hypothetical protein TNCV_4628671 [Trichonephila clavipes]